MRLSEAIRLGAMLKPQGFSGIGKDASCALRAAADAAGIEPFDETDGFLEEVVDYMELQRRFPITRARVQAPCSCADWGEEFYQAIYHMNDFHKWTREQIADWVQTIEPQDALAEQHEAVAVVVG